MNTNKALNFFIDVDNTLLNNDLIKHQIKHSLTVVLGEEEAEEFWRYHDEFRAHKQLVDFPKITSNYCRDRHTATCSAVINKIFNSIQFFDALYPNALKTLEHLKTLGRVMIFSEGDLVYQRMKIEVSGIAAKVDEVFLFEHKLKHLKQIVERFKNQCLVFIDDRDDKLMKIKKCYPDIRTVVVCQGHYATDQCPIRHSADCVIGTIDELMSFTRDNF